MSKIFYLMGKSSSGKDTIYKELLKRGEKLETIVPYTTRPIRAGEREGVEYHFTDEEQFQNLMESGKVIEHREYHTVYGIWRYFTVDDGQFTAQDDKDYLMIGTLEAYQSMLLHFGREKVFPILIQLDDGVRLKRALEREMQQEKPGYEELCRRFLADNEDFAEEKIRQVGIERRFQNDSLEQCLNEIQTYINECRNRQLI